MAHVVELYEYIIHIYMNRIYIFSAAVPLVLLKVS